ncbi:hypothetical protein [Asticcacaulis machinosus]|uniref:Uncharacterized protein n=1 Tax=Asticcacaulis machinosus TaxID=2984211 RepID=A0ABT5HLN4_9CAUL|nr:hypothetical protein [Asticcacaulis machinosus]MDC7677144.1 hypothetical protein [Asticcacaulis machinosus]
MASDYMRTDERLELINALEHSAEISDKIEENPIFWKWLIVAFHNALQGAFVCYLDGSITGLGTSGLSVLDDHKKDDHNNQLQTLRWLNGDMDGEMPNPKLAPIRKLYQRLSEVEYVGEWNVVVTSRTTDSALKRLVDFRNEFIHFTPKGLSVELNGFPQMVLTLCDLVEVLALVKPTYSRHMDEAKNSRLADALSKLRANMGALKY